jgi:hypothetical protein
MLPLSAWREGSQGGCLDLTPSDAFFVPQTSLSIPIPLHVQASSTSSPTPLHDPQLPEPLEHILVHSAQPLILELLFSPSSLDRSL